MREQLTREALEALHRIRSREIERNKQGNRGRLNRYERSQLDSAILLLEILEKADV